MNIKFSYVDKTLAEASDDSVDNGVSLDYSGEPSQNLLKFEPVTEEFVRDLLLCLRSYRPGYDELPIQVYKEYFYLLGSSITKICNDNLLLGKFPNGLAIAKVECLHKLDSKKLIENYRPISNLPGFSKITEKIVTN